jgi:GH15 family glucan-1,4-alpha-glucosidase
MSYQPIENYGIIGNMRTVALVGLNGSIDWYCYPHFDSPSVFGAILDDKREAAFKSPPTLMACGTSSFIHLQNCGATELIRRLSFNCPITIL